MISFFKKMGIDLRSVCAFVLMLVTLPVWIVFPQAYMDPASHNYQIDYLEPGEPVDGYLHTGESMMTMVFAGLLVVLMIALVLDLQLRKKSSHVFVTMLVLTLVFGYVLALGIFNFVVNKDILTGIVGILAAALVAACAALYFKKTLDGDCKLPYFVFFILAALIVYAISVSNYNLLDAFNHQGDVVFWCGYATSRAFLLSFLLITWVNHGSDYEPAGAQLEADI